MAKNKPKRKLVKGVDWHGWAFKRYPSRESSGGFWSIPTLYTVKPKATVWDGEFVKVKLVEVE